ncbi:MAG: roadblock/LC7 domain-containing protein [Chloroflexi bacterium]|nr:MAG: roadblock/LC7 domain-containing protein [Chloroflexota bacterium]
MLNAHQVALATRCLWGLQESTTTIEGVVLVGTNGIAITATLNNIDQIQRLSALSAALFLLGEQTSETAGRGVADEVQIQIRKGNNQLLLADFRPIGLQAVLVTLHQGSPEHPTLEINIVLAVNYLGALLRGEELQPPHWRQ